MGTPRISKGVRWRLFSDGVVVYVGETCETHLLPLHFAGLLSSVSSSELFGELDVPNEPQPVLLTCHEARNLYDAELEAMIELKILVRVN